ncbi:MAG: hypothetical protein NDJ75_02200 [Thermoanaerobaculia bacterium]|nr:hypothetical protein [Thermoanaerobaculia bacterium]
MWLRSIGLALAIGAASGCGVGGAVDAAERAEIEARLALYAAQMAQAYESGDASRVAGVATGREVERLRISIEELAVEGRALRPVLRSQVIESIDRAGNTAVAVGTLEVWDLRVVTSGGEQTVSESLAQENRLTYSLVHEEGEWRVLSRLLRSSTEGE